MDAAIVESVRRKFAALRPVLDERARRQWAASEAMELGWGGTSTVAETTGMSRVTITAGITELKARQDSTEEEETTRVRRFGGGRKALTQTDAELMQTLESLVDPVTRGDPMSPLRWTCQTRRPSEH